MPTNCFTISRDKNCVKGFSRIFFAGHVFLFGDYFFKKLEKSQGGRKISQYRVAKRIFEKFLNFS
jgi:hypothetical protein